MSVRSPKIKRDASVKVVFFLSKKTTFTEASLFIFGQRTDVTALNKIGDFTVNISTKEPPLRLGCSQKVHLLGK